MVRQSDGASRPAGGRQRRAQRLWGRVGVLHRQQEMEPAQDLVRLQLIGCMRALASAKTQKPIVQARQEFVAAPRRD